MSGEKGDRFGRTLLAGIEGIDVLVGAPGYDGAGAAYGFSLSDPSEDVVLWTADASTARIGAALAFVDDDCWGSRLMVGAPDLDGDLSSIGAALSAELTANSSGDQDLGELYVGAKADFDVGATLVMLAFDATSCGDLAIGAPGYGPDTATERGAVLIVPNGEGADDSTVFSADAGGLLVGGADGDNLGESLASAGDTNADGFDDLLIGAPGYDSERGVAYLVLGGSDALPEDTRDLIGFSGATESMRVGDALSGGGDLNDDGYDDIAIATVSRAAGTGHEGQLYLVWGAATLTGQELPKEPAAEGDGVALITWPADSGGKSLVLTPAEDITGDGVDDLLVGAPDNDAQVSDEGIVYVIAGDDSNLWGGLTLRDAALEIGGASQDDRLGAAMLPLGDGGSLLLGAPACRDGVACRAAGSVFSVALPL